MNDNDGKVSVICAWQMDFSPGESQGLLPLDFLFLENAQPEDPLDSHLFSR